MLPVPDSYRGTSAEHSAAPACIGHREPDNTDRDCRELDKSRDTLVEDVNEVIEELKDLASQVTWDQLDNGDKDLEKQVQATFARALVSVQMVWLQSFLLAVDNAIEDAGAEAEQVIIQQGAAELGIPQDGVEARRAEGYAYGSIALGYLLAKAAELDPEEVWERTNEGVSWAQLAREFEIDSETLEKVGKGFK